MSKTIKLTGINAEIAIDKFNKSIQEKDLKETAWRNESLMFFKKQKIDIPAGVFSTHHYNLYKELHNDYLIKAAHEKLMESCKDWSWIPYTKENSEIFVKALRIVFANTAYEKDEWNSRHILSMIQVLKYNIIAKRDGRELKPSQLYFWYSLEGSTGKTYRAQLLAKFIKKIGLSCSIGSQISDTHGRPYSTNETQNNDFVVYTEAKTLDAFKNLNYTLLNNSLDHLPIITSEKFGKPYKSDSIAEQIICSNCFPDIEERRKNIIYFSEIDYEENDCDKFTDDEIINAWNDVFKYCPSIEDMYFNNTKDDKLVKNWTYKEQKIAEAIREVSKKGTLPFSLFKILKYLCLNSDKETEYSYRITRFLKELYLRGVITFYDKDKNKNRIDRNSLKWNVTYNDDWYDSISISTENVIYEKHELFTILLINSPNSPDSPQPKEYSKKINISLGFMENLENPGNKVKTTTSSENNDLTDEEKRMLEGWRETCKLTDKEQKGLEKTIEEYNYKIMAQEHFASLKAQEETAKNIKQIIFEDRQRERYIPELNEYQKDLLYGNHIRHYTNELIGQNLSKLLYSGFYLEEIKENWKQYKEHYRHIEKFGGKIQENSGFREWLSIDDYEEAVENGFEGKTYDDFIVWKKTNEYVIEPEQSNLNKPEAEPANNKQEENEMETITQPAAQPVKQKYFYDPQKVYSREYMETVCHLKETINHFDNEYYDFCSRLNKTPVKEIQNE